MSINKINRGEVERFRKTLFVNRNALDFYQEIATKCAIYPGQGTPLGLAYTALKMNGEAGEFAEHVGKAMRDDELMERGTLTAERRTALIKEIGDVLWYVSAACQELGISLSYAATINLEKLLDRTERDVLRGSGDER